MGSDPDDNLTNIIGELVEALVRELDPDTVILFGSGTKGVVREGSDLDFLVVVPDMAPDRSEITRAYRAVDTVKGRPPVDVLVFPREDVEKWRDVVGHIINEALVTGRILYESS